MSITITQLKKGYLIESNSDLKKYACENLDSITSTLKQIYPRLRDQPPKSEIPTPQKETPPKTPKGKAQAQNPNLPTKEDLLIPAFEYDNNNPTKNSA